MDKEIKNSNNSDGKTSESKYKYKIAVASSDGIVVNQHFGRANQFMIYGLKEDNTPHYIETRNVNPVCEGGTHDDNKLSDNIKLFSDCKYILISRIGQGASYMLERNGITPMELPGIIEESIEKLVVYEQLQNLF